MELELNLIGREPGDEAEDKRRDRAVVEVEVVGSKLFPCPW